MHGRSDRYFVKECEAQLASFLTKSSTQGRNQVQTKELLREEATSAAA